MDGIEGLVSGSAGVLSIVGVAGTSMMDGVVECLDLGFLGRGGVAFEALSEFDGFLLLVVTDIDVTGNT